jgi:hypothetical protein
MKPVDYIGVALACLLAVYLMGLVTGSEPSLFVYVGSPIAGLIFYKWVKPRGSV